MKSSAILFFSAPQLLLIVGILLLAYLTYMVHMMRKQTGIEKREKTPLSFGKILPDYRNKRCELYVKDPMPSIDIVLSVTGVLVDLDEEWLMLEVEIKKKTSMKMFRIENVKSVKEITS